MEKFKIFIPRLVMLLIFLSLPFFIGETTETRLIITIISMYAIVAVGISCMASLYSLIRDETDDNIIEKLKRYENETRSFSSQIFEIQQKIEVLEYEIQSIGSQIPDSEPLRTENARLKNELAVSSNNLQFLIDEINKAAADMQQEKG